MTPRSRFRPLAALLALLLAPLAGTAPLPTAAADGTSHTWTCHANALATGCPGGLAAAPGDTVWFHYHGPASPVTHRWAQVVDSLLPTPVYFCVERTASGGGDGPLTLQLGHVYVISWSRVAAGACPAVPTTPDRVPDPTFPVTVVVPNDLSAFSGCFSTLAIQPYDQHCAGDHSTHPGCSGVQQNEHDGGGRLTHTHYVDVCTGAGDAYVCEGDEHFGYASSAASGPTLASSAWTHGHYDEVCAGMVDWCAGVWRESGKLDPSTGERAVGSREWQTDPVCPYRAMAQ